MRAGENPALFYMKYLAAFFLLFIICIVILADRGQLGPLEFLYDFPYGDKFGHFILFGLLNLFFTLAFLRALPNRNSYRVALAVGLILALAIAAEEYSQQYFSTRTFDLIDLAASYLGVLAGGWIALRLQK